MPDATQHSDHHDINTRAVLGTGLAIIVMLALAGMGAYVAWSAWRGTLAHDAPNTELNFRIAGPVLQSAPQPEREAFMRDKERWLQSFGWVDPVAGVAHIPIADAMRILAERGRLQPSQGARQARQGAANRQEER